jgi:hypothetical protein
VREIVDAVQDAPDDVRETFEDEINIYSGLLDEYVPLGSNVTVAQRRTIVVVTAAVASPVAVTPSRRRPR